MILTSTLKLLYTIQSITLIHKRENCRIAIIGFHPGQRVIYSPSQYSKTFAPSSLIAISNFKEEKMIHFAPNRTMNRGKLCSLHRFTKFVKTSNLPNRSKSGSGSFEAEWKAIGSSNVISATNPQMNGPPRSLVAGYESDINRGQPFQDCSNSFRPVINL